MFFSLIHYSPVLLFLYSFSRGYRKAVPGCNRLSKNDSLFLSIIAILLCCSMRWKSVLWRELTRATPNASKKRLCYVNSNTVLFWIALQFNQVDLIIIISLGTKLNCVRRKRYSDESLIVKMWHSRFYAILQMIWMKVSYFKELSKDLYQWK